LPHAEPFWKTFHPQVVRLGEVALKYTATGIAAPEPGEPPGQWRCNGRSARELYEHVVVPELKEFRDRCTLADRV
jgi:hypothetical protein